VNYDLPCRLIFVVGMPSGGTSATAGTLVKNGFWCSTGERHNFEQPEIIGSLKGPFPGYNCWSRPDLQVTSHDRYRAAMTFRRYKQRALTSGFDKAVAKVPGISIWVPEMFINLPLGVTVEPLLVYRDPAACAASTADRFPKLPYPEKLAEDGQAEILRLHEAYGWPMWRFGKDADINELGALLGVDLTQPHYDANVVRH